MIVFIKKNHIKTKKHLEIIAAEKLIFLNAHETLPHIWCTSLKRAPFDLRSSLAHFLVTDGMLLHKPADKVCRLLSVSDVKQCGDDVDLPHICDPYPLLERFVFQ